MSAIKSDHSGSLCVDSTGYKISGVGAWEYDIPSGQYRGTSESCALRGIRGEATVNRYTASEWWLGIHYTDRQRLEQTMDYLFRSSVQQISARYRYWFSKTHWRWILTRASIAERDDQGKPLLISGVDIDVTEINEEQYEIKRLREQAERTDIALASAGQGLWHVDLRLGIRTENDTWRTMRGYPADSTYCSDERWLRDIHPDDLGQFIRDDYSKSTSSDVVDQTYRQRHASGNWQWIWSRGKVVERDSKNLPLVLIGTDTDITRIKEAEIRFERLSNTLEIAVQTAGMGVWEWTVNSQVNTWDRNTFEIFGIKAESKLVPHEVFMSLVHPEDRADVEARLDHWVAERKDIDISYRIVNPEKGIRFINAKASCHETDSEAARYVGIVWDVTDKVNADQERVSLVENLSHARRLQSLGELTGGIAHDVNNLLAIISGNAELLSHTLQGENQSLNAIVAASFRGAELTQGLLAFSRKQSLTPVSVALDTLVNNLNVMLSSTLGPKVTIETFIGPDIWQCEADPGQLENALINLMVNARDAMPKGGVIMIGVENVWLDEAFVSLTQNSLPGEFVKLSVADTGYGMSKQVLDKAVDPFFSTKMAGEGHGLGLSMVFGFIKQSNGHIIIESLEGSGTCVCLYLPRYNGDQPDVHTQKDDNEHLPKGGGQSILIVEDELPVQEMLIKLVEYLGYTAIGVSSASEALQFLTRENAAAELIISDIVLSGGMNGLELGEEIAKRYPTVPVLYISGYAEDILRGKSVNDKEVDVLQKPFTVEKLADSIARRLSVS